MNGQLKSSKRRAATEAGDHDMEPYEGLAVRMKAFWIGLCVIDDNLAYGQ